MENHREGIPERAKREREKRKLEREESKEERGWLLYIYFAFILTRNSFPPALVPFCFYYNL